MKPVSFRISAEEGEEIDRARGDESRGAFARRVTLAASGDAGGHGPKGGWPVSTPSLGDVRVVYDE